MNYDIQSIITLNDDKKYMVMSKTDFESITYLFLMNTEDDKDYKFCHLNEEGKLFELKNEDKITTVAPLLYKKLLEEIEKI